MHRSLSSGELAHGSVVSRAQAASRALADHAFAGPSQPAARRRHASLPAGATASTWVPPLVPVCVGRQENVALLIPRRLN